jgi:hypothetical protein
LRSLVLDDLNQVPSTITIAGTSAPTAFRFGNIQDLSLTTGSVINTLTAKSWINGPAVSDSLTAPSVKAMRINGNLDAVITLNGTASDLGSLVVNGSAAGVWTLGGSATALNAKSFTSTFAANITGNVTSLVSRLDFDGSLSAQSVKVIRIGGNLSGGSITLSGANLKRGMFDVRSLTVVGTLTGATINSAGNIGSVVVSGANASSIFAGVASGQVGLPATTAAFTAAASILSFTTRGKFAFADTFIAAENVGPVALHNVTTTNNGDPFGVAATKLTSLSLVQKGKKPFAWNAKKAVSLLSTLPDDLKAEILT